MIPKRVVLENFLSHGMPATEIVFSDDEPLWVLCGRNGVGKSAVFDAMTYALFGCHRGGKQNADQLIRHGADKFRVVFEFEFVCIDYRITRTRTRGGRTTQKIERRDATTDSWMAVPGVNSAVEVDRWVIGTLGLGFDQFTASVLLRQGEADRIVAAGPTERGALLKKIIGAERFVALGVRVHDAVKRCKGQFEDLRGRKDRVRPVTAEELAAADTALEQAESHRKIAHEQVQTARSRVAQAELWGKLDKKREDLEKEIREANARAEHAGQIRADKARFAELGVVPTLRQIVQLRHSLAAGNARLASFRREEENLREARRLRQEIERDGPVVATAEGAATLRKELTSFPSDLAEQLKQAERCVAEAEEQGSKAMTSKAKVEALLGQAREQERQFRDVQIGVPCSRCGQTVNAEHAEHERSRLAGEIQQLEQTLNNADTREKAAITAKRETIEEYGRLLKLSNDKGTKSTKLCEQQVALDRLGITADAETLRLQFDEKTRDADNRKRLAAEEAKNREGHGASEAQEVGWEKLSQRLEAVVKQLSAVQRAVDTDQGRHDTLFDQLSANWKSMLDSLDEPTVKQLDEERMRLDRSGVATQFEQLQQDAVFCESREKQRSDLVSEIDKIAADARIAVSDAEKLAADARQTADAADTARDNAADTSAGLRRRDEELERLTTEIAGAERQYDLHRRLDGLLGKEGLQRELVRSAEREIVHFANSTVQNLSGGELSIELDDPAEGDNEAFSLLVRKAEDPIPFSSTQLSGSEKFRVAVAVALAIGRYATGQARPLESVIIDEGFGSLDRDGLEAMAAELNRLRQFMRRVVLVSHQERFEEDPFRVGYRLTRGENGAVATPFRR
jgi:DNA repair exonuclease SbcCD ATPase subunit